MISATVARLLYLAHPVRGDVPGNLARARRWLRWLRTNAHPEAAIIAPWLLDIEVLGEDDGDPAQRERALQRCELVAQRCDVVVLVGGRISEGMRREAAAAPAIVDLTYLGEEPPL